MNHGMNGYNKGCRCDECKEASRAYFKARRERGLAEGDPRHGTLNAVRNYGCFCDLCAEASRNRKLSQPKNLNHGKASTYSLYKCRCDPCREAKRDARFKTKYGVSLEGYNEILESQQGACATCGTKPEPGAPRLAIDHNHETGQIRGILCSGCNTALGFVKEDRNIMLALVKYIDSWS